MKLLLLVMALAGCGGGTSLEPVSARAELNQQRAAEAIIAHLQGLDAGGCVTPKDLGAVESLAEAVYCSAGGNLQRASQPHEDAGVSCPAQ